MASNIRSVSTSATETIVRSAEEQTRHPTLRLKLKDAITKKDEKECEKAKNDIVDEIKRVCYFS